MRHANDHRKLGRNPGHRKALLRNLMNSLVLSERIETTVPKAKELRRLGDRLITLGKRGSAVSRHQSPEQTNGSHAITHLSNNKIIRRH